MSNLQVTPGHKAAQRGVVGAVRVACRSLCPRSGLRRSLEDQVCQLWHAMHWDSPIKDSLAGQISAPQWHAAALGMHLPAAHHFLLECSAVAATWVCKPLCKQVFKDSPSSPAVSLLCVSVPLESHTWCLPVQVLPGTPVSAPSMQRSSLCRRTI